MILTTLDHLQDRKFRDLGVVKGNTVQSKHIGKDIGAGFKTIVGGEIRGYTEMLNDARDVAVRRMVEEASKLDADAILNIRFQISELMQGTAVEALVYGTAVKILENSQK